jgi:hypothetical protein
MTMDTAFTTIQVSQEMRKRLRAIAQQQGRKMYALVDELLMAALATPRAARVVDGKLVADERKEQRDKEGL